MAPAKIDDSIKSRRMSRTTRPCAITIDPGVGLGWALWEEARWKIQCAPLDCGVYELRGLDWQERLTKTIDHAFKHFDEHWINYAYIEWPAFFDGEKGHTSARRGDLVKLCCAVGWIAGCFHSRGIPVKFIPVYQWKGQLPKPVVIRRIKQILGEKTCEGYKTHAWDAVAIGLYVKGFFS